jgi:hypothetical protein
MFISLSLFEVSKSSKSKPVETVQPTIAIDPGFSTSAAYVFEDIADSLLNSKQGLKDGFDKKKKAEDEKFRSDGAAQLKFIYDKTILEPEFMATRRGG